jgi:hypothetical protein
MGSSFAKPPSELLQGLRADLYAPDKVISTVWAWDTAAAGWKFFAPSLQESGQLSTYISTHGYQPFTAAIAQGSGYWINVVDPSPSDFFVVPTDLTKVSYPDSYQTVSSMLSDINSDPCKLDLDVLAYPRAWLGKYPLPKIQGTPLKPSVMRGMYMKDVGLGPPDNPAFILHGAPGAPNGCKGDLRAEFVKTIKKLKNLHVDYVYLPQWHWASKNPDGTWFVTKAEDTFGALSDADLAFFAQTAHASGIKIFMQNQIQGMIDGPNSGAYIPPATTENIKKWLAAFQSFMIERSVFFQSIGLDVWDMGCNACLSMDLGYVSDANAALFVSAYKDTAREVKKVYTGKTSITSFLSASWVLSDPELRGLIDIVKLPIYGAQLTESDMNVLTLESYKAHIAGTFDWFQSTIDQLAALGKQAAIEFGGVQSRLDVFTFPGYIEETGCTAEIGALNGSQDQCIQKSLKTDFSVQAIYYEALLELINGLNAPLGLTVFVGDYWETDTLTPQTAFPNMAASVRNKPAEGILKSWYAR